MDKKIIINNLNIFYTEYGKGNKNILLLHGWGQSHSFWTELAKKLGKDYHIYALDLPGFGMSQEPTYTWSIKNYAEFTNQFVMKLDMTNPIIIGHSFGGRIAIVYASKFPTKKLVLYSTSGGVSEISLGKLFHRYVIVKIGKYLFPNLIYKYHTQIFRPKNYLNKIILNKIRSRRMLDVYSQPFEDLQKALIKIHTSTLIIVGIKDYIANPRIGKKLNKLIKNSRLVEIPNATHFAHIEDQDNFYKKLLSFLAK